MKVALAQYPAYKDSGVPWLGDVPEHWRVLRLKQICRFDYGDSLPAEKREEGEVPVFGSNGCVGSHSSSNTKGPCIVIGRKGSFGKVNFSVEPVFAIDTTFFIDDRLTLQDIRWLVYLLGLLGLDEVSKDSAVPGLDREEAYQKEGPLPPLAEQAAIVKFLDYMDRRIRRYIRAKQKLIKLLEEQKQAIIHRAVTRGLDPDVRLKPSGVPWLGDVPEHWEVVSLGRIGRFSKGSGGTKSDDVSDGIPCIRYGDLYTRHEFFITASRSFVTSERAVDYTAVTYGDVLFAGSGETLDEIGKSAVCLIKGRVCCGGDVLIFRPSREMSPRFLGYVSDSPQSVHQKSCVGRGVTIMHIYAGDLKYLKIAIPPLAEQAAIVKFLDDATANIDVTISHAKQEISLQNEYRTRLIADVVTGKLDVRAAAAKLPDEQIESELLGDENAPVFDDEFEDSDADLDTEMEEVET